MPNPTSLTTTGRGASRATIAAKPSSTPANSGRPPADGLLHGVEVDGQAVGAEQLDDRRRARRGRPGTCAAPRLASSSGGRGRSRARGRWAAATGPRAAAGPSRTRAPRRARRRLSGEAAVDVGRRRGAAGHGRDQQRGAQPLAPSNSQSSADVGEISLRQRAMAHAHRVEPGTGAVLDAGARGDAEVVGLAAGSGRVVGCHRSPPTDYVARGVSGWRRKPRSSRRRACRPGSGESSRTTPSRAARAAPSRRGSAPRRPCSRS